MKGVKYALAFAALLYSALPLKAQNLLNLGYDGKYSFLEHSIKTKRFSSFLKAQYNNKDSESYKSNFLDLDVVGINPTLDYALEEKSDQNTNEKIKSYLGGIKLTPRYLTIEASLRKEINKTNTVELNSSSEHDVDSNLWTYVNTKSDTNVTTTSSIESLFGECDLPLSKFIKIGPFASYTRNKTTIDGSSVVESTVTVTGTDKPHDPDPTYSKTITPIKSNIKSRQKAIGLTLKPDPYIINIWRSYNENKWEADLKWDAYLTFKLDRISNLVYLENLGSKDSKLEYTLLIPTRHPANLKKLSEFQKDKDKINKRVSLSRSQKEAETRHLEKKHDHNNLKHHLKVSIAMNKFNGILKPGLCIGYIGKNSNIELMVDDDNTKIDLEFKNIGISVTKPNNEQDKLGWYTYILLPFK